MNTCFYSLSPRIRFELTLTFSANLKEFMQLAIARKFHHNFSSYLEEEEVITDIEFKQRM